MYKVKRILHILELLVYIIQYFLDFAVALCKMIYYYGISYIMIFFFATISFSSG